jgi:hypothetical protein
MMWHKKVLLQRQQQKYVVNCIVPWQQISQIVYTRNTEGIADRQCIKMPANSPKRRAEKC